MLAAGGGESGFDSVPRDEDRGERAKQVLAHSVEETEVLGEQGVDGLEDVLQIVGLHCRQLLRRSGVFLRTFTECGSFEGNWEGCRPPAPCSLRSWPGPAFPHCCRCS